MNTPSRPRIAAWILAGIALLAILLLHLLPALLGALLVYELVHLTAPALERRLSDRRAKQVAVALLALAVGSAVVGAIAGMAAFFRSDAGSLTALAQKMAEILDSTRQSLPEWMSFSLPANAEDLREMASHWLRNHAGEVQLAGKEAVRGFAHLLVGAIIGGVVALREATTDEQMRPLARELGARAARLADAFRKIVFAQVRISALNTVVTAAYLLVVLPLCGVHLPLAKTLVAVTFVAGLLPVVGNLVSNTVIVVVSLSHSPLMAAVSLGYLVIIHKLEYFLNAVIIGSRVQARAWELLLAMLVLEAAFGLAGVVAAPIFYAYLKTELIDAKLV